MKLKWKLYIKVELIMIIFLQAVVGYLLNTQKIEELLLIENVNNRMVHGKKNS